MGKKIYFRADASPEIGYGHFIRSLALADMLKNDFECVFFTQSPSQYQRHQISVICQLIELPSNEDRFSKFLDCLSGDEIVVLDNYFYTPEYQQTIMEKGCSLVCIDDMHDKHYYADIVINHCLNDPSLFDVEPYTRLCLGFEWALLRRPFLQKHTSAFETGHWLVSFGGSDYYNLTDKFLTILDGKPGVRKITAIVGDGYRYPETLEKFPKVRFLRNLTAEEMCEHMVKAEYAILPSSSICIEALSCGCKIIGGYYVDNQKEFYEYLKTNNYIYPIGDLNCMDKNEIVKFSLESQIKNNHGLDTSKIQSNYISIFSHL